MASEWRPDTSGGKTYAALITDRWEPHFNVRNFSETYWRTAFRVCYVQNSLGQCGACGNWNGPDLPWNKAICVYDRTSFSSDRSHANSQELWRTLRIPINWIVNLNVPTAMFCRLILLEQLHHLEKSNYRSQWAVICLLTAISKCFTKKFAIGGTVSCAASLDLFTIYRPLPYHHNKNLGAIHFDFIIEYICVY